MHKLRLVSSNGVVPLKPSCAFALCHPELHRPPLVRSIFTGKEVFDQPEPERDRSLKLLSQPIGLQDPPQIGENSGIETRSWQEKRADTLNYDKHLMRRKELIEQVKKPYFREWTDANYHKGKTFLSPSRLFRADKSLYFPNFVGNTLATPSDLSDTTPILRDKVSVVSLVSGQWAENQKATFVSEKNNPELAQLLRNEGGILQKVEVNIEEDWMKALFVRMFMQSLKRQRKKEDWGNYFLVKRGVTDEIRRAIAQRNGKVGYIYLVDWKCRIRWAGSGDAYEGERESLIAGCRRLIEAWKAEQKNESIRPKDLKEKSAGLNIREKLPRAMVEN